MDVCGRLLLIGMALFALGCTKGAPIFEVLDSGNIPQPTFSGQTTKSLWVSSSTDPIAVSGQCDQKITSLVAQAVGGASSQSLSAMTTGTVNVNCATDGTFSLTLNSLTSLGFAIVDNTTYEVQLRGLTSAGLSNPSSLKILYSTTGGSGPKRISITSGSTESKASGARLATGAFGNINAEIRINHMGAAAASGLNASDFKTSTNFRMKSGAAESAN